METESLFTALLLALVALVVRDIRSQGAKRFLPIGIGVVAGLAYWIGTGIVSGRQRRPYLITSAWRVPRERRGSDCGPADSGLAGRGRSNPERRLYGIVARRLQERQRPDPARSGYGTVRAFAHLVTGDRVPVRFGAGLAFLLFARRSRYSSASEGGSGGSRREWGGRSLSAIVYVGGVMAAALTTIAADLPRYYFPVYPLFLACAAAFCSTFAKGKKSLVVALLVFSVIAVEARNLFVPPPAPDWIVTKAILAEEVQPGLPLIEWLRQRLGPDGTIAAVEGQAVHYILQSPVVAMIPAGATSRRGDGPAFQSLMRQFRRAIPAAVSRHAPGPNSGTEFVCVSPASRFGRRSGVAGAGCANTRCRRLQVRRLRQLNPGRRPQPFVPARTKQRDDMHVETNV